MNLKALLVVAALVFAGQAAQADDAPAKRVPTGNDFVQRCSGYTLSEQGDCRVFMLKASDIFHGDPDNDGNYHVRGRACIPSLYSLQDLIDVSVAYIRAHPQWGSRPADGLVIEALAERFPCLF